MESEASHALLNPAYYPKDVKPEAVWTEAEKSDGAESPNDMTVPSAPGTDENIELPKSFSDEEVAKRQAEVEETAKKDIESGSPVASTDPEKARTAEEGEQESNGEDSDPPPAQVQPDPEPTPSQPRAGKVRPSRRK